MMLCVNNTLVQFGDWDNNSCMHEEWSVVSEVYNLMHEGWSVVS